MLRQTKLHKTKIENKHYMYMCNQNYYENLKKKPTSTSLTYYMYTLIVDMTIREQWKLIKSVFFLISEQTILSSTKKDYI